MDFLASFGSIVLTFLAGAEVDRQAFGAKFKESLLIGVLSFAIPFAGATFVTDFGVALTLALLFVRPTWWLVPSPKIRGGPAAIRAARQRQREPRR